MKRIILGSAAGLAISLAAAAALAATPAGDKGGRGFDRLDANGDGKITADEMNAKHADMIAAADANGDGGVTKEEMKAYHEKRRAEMRAKHNPDKNGDGVVDKEEYLASAEERFDRMDKNDDGVISEDEKGRGKGRRHHRGGK